jgi:hypothetical protein
VYCEDYAGYFTVILLFLAFRSCSAYFIYLVSCITPRADEHHQQLQCYYKLTEEYLEEINREWLVDLLILDDPIELSNVDSPKVVCDTPRPSKTKKNEESQDVHSTLGETPSISSERGGDGGEIDGTKFEQRKGEVTPPRDEEDPAKKRKVSPLKPSSRKKMKATRTKFETTLMPDDFKFIIASLNDGSLEIEKK